LLETCGEKPVNIRADELKMSSDLLLSVQTAIISAHRLVLEQTTTSFFLYHTLKKKCGVLYRQVGPTTRCEYECLLVQLQCEEKECYNIKKNYTLAPTTRHCSRFRLATRFTRQQWFL
jgi:hypothetical protein